MPRPPLILSLTGGCVMSLVLAYGLVNGSFVEEGGRLLGMPWGRVTLVDVYVGLALFSAWIFRRERSKATAALWTAAILVTGNLGSCCYVLRAAATSGGDARRFWMGADGEA